VARPFRQSSRSKRPTSSGASRAEPAIALTSEEADLLRRAKEAFGGAPHVRASTIPEDRDRWDDPDDLEVGAPRPTSVPEEPSTIEILLAESFGSADVLVGAFEWPSESPFWSNTALERLLDTHPADERSLVHLLDEWSQAHFLVRALPHLLRHGQWRGRLVFVDGQSAPRPSLATFVAYENEEGVTDALTLMAVPIGDTLLAPPEQIDLRARPADSDQLVAALVQHVTDLILATDRAGRVTFMSPAASALLGFDASDGVTLLDRLHPDDRPIDLDAIARQADDVALPPIPLRIQAADGTWRDLAAVITDMTEMEAIGGYVVNASDVTEAVRAAQEITAKAYTDQLTGLANRVRLLDRLEGVAHARPGVCTLEVVSVDHLDQIVVEHGALGRDAVLVVTADRLRSAAGDLSSEALTSYEALTARLQGGEFAMLVPGVDDVDTAAELGDRLRELLRQPVWFDGRTITPTVSVGVASSAMAGHRACGAPPKHRSAASTGTGERRHPLALPAHRRPRVAGGRRRRSAAPSAW
jgi:PAS domain S-box-containing protein